MAILEDALKGGNIVTGLAVGLGAVVLAPLAAPLLRPITRTVLKAGLIAYDQAKVAVAEMNERASDLVAEARAEMAETEPRTTRKPNGPRESESRAESKTTRASTS